MSKPLFRLLSIALLTCILIPSTTFAAAVQETKTASSNPYHIVALGDSVTVGYEPGLDETATPYGYTERVYEQALFHSHSVINNFGILGLTTSGLSNLLQGAAAGKTLKAVDLQDFSTFVDPRIAQYAQTIAAKSGNIKSTLSEADLVIMTTGGNDFGDFIKAVVADSTNLDQLIQTSFIPMRDQYLNDLKKVINQVHEMAPKARIAIADQYLPLIDLHPAYGALKSEVITLSKKLDELAAELNQVQTFVEIVHVSEGFFGKERQYTYVGKQDPHPTQKGYEYIGQQFANVIWKEYRTPAPRAADVTLSVIINGKELVGKPINKKNTNFLPIREVANAVKAELKWDNKTKTATFRKNNREVMITIGANTMTINGVIQKLDTPAYLETINKQQYTYVPLAAIVKGLDFDLVYQQTLKTAFINGPL
ncbi:MAG: stalk domain-containing protein [Candidatus Cohnella colombiensis]|uniref:Stalk domain-containing protein n=1 Tax=Candidatus Cohnella colombiensis TaxID=3121368 RepID=A0AA95JC79_9BACL|nr:MAG: stalk domain-containing protein [Cohnella sp.]